MAIKEMAKDLGSSITGNIESAYITVHDFRGAGDSGLTEVAAIRKALVEGTNGFALENAVNRRFRVQFNPSELQIYSTTEPVEKLNAQKDEKAEKKDSLVDSPIGARLELSTNLFFDHMNVSNSFMMDKPMLPASVSGVTNLVTLGMGDKFTVQTEVEGFIAALRNIYTQTVTFQWADFSFTGTLLHVGAQYTMFSMQGNPVRAKILLRIRQEKGGQKMQSWIDDFGKGFGKDQSNLVRTEQKVGSILNLGQ